MCGGRDRGVEVGMNRDRSEKSRGKCDVICNNIFTRIKKGVTCDMIQHISK